jgi:hypothetical protein
MTTAELEQPAQSLSAFLEARIAHDEAVAREAIAMRDRIDYTNPPTVPDLGFMAFEDLGVPAVVVGPERVLAECEAKRRIVDACSSVMGNEDPHASLDEDGWVSLMWETMYALALPYAAHPDYREEWRA